MFFEKREIMKTHNGMIALFIALSISGASCTKQRPAAWPDGVSQTLFTKEEILSSQIILLTSDEVIPVSEEKSLTAIGEVARVKVISAIGSERLKPLFKNLVIEAAPHSKVEVVFGIDDSFVTAYQVLFLNELELLSVKSRGIAVTQLEKNGLTGAEKIIFERFTDPEARALVPIFKVEIQEKGTAVRVLHDLGEETRSLRLTPSDWETASHIRISTLSSKRRDVRVERADADVIFLKERLKGKIFSKNEFVSKMHVPVNLPEDSIVSTTIAGSRLNLYQIASQRELDEIKRATLGTRDDVLKCSVEQIKAVQEHIASDECAAVLVAFWEVKFVDPKLALVDSSATSPKTSQYEFKPTGAKDGTLFRLEKGQASEWVQSVSEVEAISQLDPSRILDPISVSGQEYIWRTTVLDAPSNYRGRAFEGLASDLEIVKFVFEAKRVRIIRAQPVVKRRKQSLVDLETLVSLPVEYYKRVDVALQKPLFRKVDVATPGAVALIDWNSDQLSVRSVVESSPQRCMEKKRSDQTLWEVKSKSDSKKQLEALSFSIGFVYEANYSDKNCVSSDVGRGEILPTQTFAFKERIALRRLDDDHIPNQSLNIPFWTQKALGFGLFTTKVKELDQYDRGETVNTDHHLAHIYELSKEDHAKKITFILTGLPEAGDERDRVVVGAKRAIESWNDAFKKALKDTPSERPGDVLELKIEGEPGTENAVLGDLDTNFIHYVQKTADNVPLGLASAATSPKTGKVLASTVLIYGGDIFSGIADHKLMYRLKKDHTPEIAPLVKSNEVSGSDTSAWNAMTEISKSDAGTLSSKMQSISNRNGTDLSVMNPKALKWNSKKWLESEMEAETDFTDSINPISALANVVDSGTGRIRSGKPGKRELGESDSRGFKILNGCELKMEIRAPLSNLVFATYGGKKFESLSDIELFGIYIDFAMMHELGHVFGLRHNFAGSFDKENFNESPKDNSKREYSSIMDYPALETLATANGLGSYDVATIRAAYAGMVELSAPSLERLGIKDSKNKIQIAGSTLLDGSVVNFDIYGGRLVSLDDYLKKFMGKNYWADLTPEMIARAPLKKYLFCTDEDVGVFPTCQRYDLGTTPLEIVKNAILDYDSFYLYRNFAWDRTHFDVGNVRAYIEGLEKRFVSIRSFLDEAYFLASTRAPSEWVSANFQAAIEGYHFFRRVVNAPDALSASNENALTRTVEKQNGSKFRFEPKMPKTKFSDQSAERLSVIGYEYDKAMAISMLTGLGVNQPRHTRILGEPLKVSYLDLEKMALPGAKGEDLPMIRLLSDILSASMSPYVQDEGGKPLSLVGNYRSGVTRLMRSYTVIAASDWMDRADFNVETPVHSTFRVRSGTQAPEGIESITTDGILYYWPIVLGNSAASSLIKRANVLGAIRSEVKPVLAKIVDHILVPALNGQAVDPGLESALGEELKKVVPTGYSGNTQISAIREGVAGAIKIVKEMRDQSAKLTPSQNASERERTQIRLASIANEEPIVMTVLNLIPGDKIELPELELVKSKSLLDNQEQSILNGIQGLSAIFEARHPEYFRP